MATDQEMVSKLRAAGADIVREAKDMLIEAKVEYDAAHLRIEHAQRHAASILAAADRLEAIATPTSPLVSTTEGIEIIPSDGEVIDLSGKLYYGLSLAQWRLGDSPPSVWPTHYEASSIGKPDSDERFPVSIKGSARNFTIDNLTTRHLLHDRAPWHIWKLLGDSDGVRFECGGEGLVTRARIDNVTDGINPRRGGSDACFAIRDSWLSRVHDDCVENDEVMPGIISNCLMQGHTFYSARGWSNPSAVVLIKNCVVELLLQPFQGGSDSDDYNDRGGYLYADGLGCGCLFKMQWNETTGSLQSGSVVVRDTVFLVPRHSSSSNKAMRFPLGTYENSTLVWLGEGNYPQPIPQGVAVTRDASVFERARDKWLASHLDVALRLGG